ncbi:MAG: mycofactocin system FadH/OYE family oxidoreductase 2 [Actinobacteria bacterium]|nr:mycofactocin system FadH/OYE family oxidoreductase 2 [Actinomycetota bacterium]
MQFPLLFSPLRIGRVEVPNRISFSAHLTNLAEHGLPTDRLTHYLAARARGGAGLIITEEQSVHPTDRAYEHLIEAFLPEVVAEYRKLTRAVHEFDTRIFAQLNHNGQQCSGHLSRLPVWAPSAVPDVLYREVPKVMEPEDIAEVIEYFQRSAVHVREGGFDGVELQFGHSSLARQFMSPLTNYRDDEYGGDAEKRLRFPLELVAAVRGALGSDYTLGVRLCADELIPGGLTLDDAKVIAQRMEATGHLDFINLTLSTFYNLYLVGGTMHLPLGYTVPLAAGVKEAVSLPVFATGRINDPALAERVLADGQADMIGVVRGQIADPDFARKARDGRTDDIRYCIACNQNCYGRVGLNRSIGCVQNPAVGAEAAEGERLLKPTRNRKRVMVVGGGPAGMWAAKVAALRGHDVTLYEKGDELGGQVLIAAKGAGRDEFGVIVRNERNQLERAGVSVVLDTEVTLELVAEVRPAAVIVATGSRPKTCPVAGGDGPDVVNVWQVLRDEVTLGERVALIDYDGHHQATATAEALADRGKTVHVVTSSLFVGSELGPSQDLYLSRQRLLQKGVAFTPDFAVMEIKGTEIHGFNVYSNEWDVLSPYDSVVTAMGNDADDSLYFALKGVVPELYRVGDCVAPRKVDMAILEGYAAGKRV